MVAREDDHRVARLEAVHLREDLVERLLALVVAAAEAGAAAERARPIASSSSMKMIAGAASLACLKRSRTREAPMPTIASTNSRAPSREERHARLARDRAREQRLAGARAAREQHAARDPAAERLVLLRVLEEVDDLGQLVLGLVDAGDVLERDALAALDALRARAAERAQGPAAARGSRAA